MFLPHENPEAVRSHVSQSPQHRPQLIHRSARNLTLPEAHWLVREAAIRDWPLSLMRAAPGDFYEDLYAISASEEATEIRERHWRESKRAKVGGTNGRK